MKTLSTILATVALGTALTACHKPATSQSSTPENHAEPKNSGAGDAVQFKAGHGLAFHPKLKESLGLKVAEVADAPVASQFTAQLHVIQGADGLQKVSLEPARSEASGWISADKASRLQPGQEVDLLAELPGLNAPQKGIIKSVEKAAYAALGDFEVIVQTESSLPSGARLAATFHSPAGEPVPSVPRSALLKTVEGWFVYAVNEEFYVRTAVKVGAMNDERAEITDGLYAGDQIVTAPVNSLWMAELQILRGGKSCTCGH